ncbi:Fc receptor-like protein 4 [Fukomys damarensis]|uniref:Fc receptor-like protein 4 n=1 Tax=Fukomys damarensis TaxID=885580 RepID=UPI00053FEC85|nr:Fc receptor-like protein 4 [Fukomys damarensis]
MAYSATIPISVISLHPPWTTVFQGETVNLTCNGFHFYAPEKAKWYHWYHGRKLLPETSGNILEVRETGMYRCWAEKSHLSAPVSLIFATDSLILQSPYSVFEGDKLVLRCWRAGREKLTTVKYSWNRKIFHTPNKSFDHFIPKASSNNSGTYQCIGYDNQNGVFKSNTKIIKIQELFPHPELKVSATKPTEGTSVNKSCETRLLPERSDTSLHFIFFRDNMLVLSDWNESSALQIPAIWKENSGSYGRGAKTVTHNISKHSFWLKIQVQRIPVSEVSMETHPPGGQAIEGEMLILVCSAAEGTGDITFSWHIGGTKESLGWKTLRSQRAELEIPVIWESHAGAYYCMTDNSYGPVQSEVMNITCASVIYSEVKTQLPDNSTGNVSPKDEDITEC